MTTGIVSNAQASLRDAQTGRVPETGDKSPAYYLIVPLGRKEESLTLTPMGFRRNDGSPIRHGTCEMDYSDNFQQ
jgi:hypothetical protein